MVGSAEASSTQLSSSQLAHWNQIDRTIQWEKRQTKKRYTSADDNPHSGTKPSASRQGLQMRTIQNQPHDMRQGAPRQAQPKSARSNSHTGIKSTAQYNGKGDTKKKYTFISARQSGRARRHSFQLERTTCIPIPCITSHHKQYRPTSQI